MTRPFRGHSPFPAARGFTMLELMVVVAILAILAALAAPSMVPVIDRWRVRQVAEEMVATMAFARSEAIKWGGDVTVARSTPGTDQCALPTNVADWRCGWTVSSGTTVLRESPLGSGVSVTRSTSSGSFALTRWGDPATGGAVTFVVASTRSGSTVRSAVCLGGGGRIRSKAGASTCD
ncbi:MAG: GspH/FimT family pseudopilin [Pseudorhodoferax sp.]